MTTLTSTELGATGRYIRFVASALNNLGSQTVMSRCRPTGPGGGNIGYLYGKNGSSPASGPRLFVSDNSGAPRISFGAHSTTTASKPTRNGANNSVVYNTWQDLAATWDGTLISSGIVVYVNGVNVSLTYSALENGTGAVADDSAHAVTLLNREDLGREFVGDVAWIAVWDRVLTTTEMDLARSDGPLEVPDGLVLLWANQADLGPNSLTPESRSTYVAGALPSNTALGGTPAAGPVSFTGTVPAQSWDEDAAITPLDLSSYFTGDLTPFSYAVTTGTLPAGLSLNGSTGVISGTPTTPASAVSIVVTATDASSNTAVTNAFNITITEAGVAPVLREDYERSSVNLAGSSVSGTGDDAVITIKPRMQETEAVATSPRWLEPSVRVDNVNGFRPSFKFIDYAATAAANKYHGAPWQTTRRPMFSYDRLTWHYFDTQTITASEIQFRHNTAFTADTVYVGRSRQVSVTQVGEWLEGIAAAHPTKIAPTATASAFTPTLTSWPAQAFIAGEYASQIDELGRTVPQTPFWAFEINDTALGGTKRLATMTAGVHAGEDHSDVAFQRMVEHLLGSSAEAIALRTAYRILVYPMINAPGRAGGGWRGSFTQGTGGADDANRNFTAINGLEIVSLPRSVITADRASVVPDWHIDWHGAVGRDYGLYVNPGLNETFRTRATTQFGTTVEDMGPSTNDSVTKYFKDTVGCVMAITLEHGDKTQQSDAALVSWGGAVVRTLESMREDGLFYSVYETASGEVASLSLSAPAGVTATTTAASGTVASLILTAPDGDATTASTTFASGDIAALSITAPESTSTTQTAASAGIQTLSLTAPTGDASSASTTFASGDVAPISLAAPEGTTAQSAASSGAIQHISLTAPNGDASTLSSATGSGAVASLTLASLGGATYSASEATGGFEPISLTAANGNASTVAETLASGAVASLTLTPSNGATSVSTAAAGAQAGITLLAVEGDANSFTYTLVEGDLAPITLTAPDGSYGVDVAGQGAMAGVAIAAPNGRGFDPTAAGETVLGYATRTRDVFVVTRTTSSFARVR